MFEQFRPKAAVSYEHVFCSTRTSTLAQRAHRALSLTRAFLLLEDGDPVDWEVDQEELAATTQRARVGSRAPRATVQTTGTAAGGPAGALAAALSLPDAAV